MSYDKSAEDVVTNFSNNPSIEDVIEQRLADPTRRHVLAGGAGAAALSIFGLGTVGLAGCSSDNDSKPDAPAVKPVEAPVRAAALGFAAIAKINSRRVDSTRWLHRVRVVSLRRPDERRHT